MFLSFLKKLISVPVVVKRAHGTTVKRILPGEAVGKELGFSDENAKQQITDVLKIGALNRQPEKETMNSMQNIKLEKFEGIKTVKLKDSVIIERFRFQTSLMSDEEINAQDAMEIPVVSDTFKD